MTKISCRFVDLPMISRELKREYRECYTWRDRVVERLRELEPDLTIVSVARSMQATNDRDNDPTRQGEAMAPLFEGVTGKIAIIVDTPQSKYDVPACISDHRDDVRRCETARDGAFNWRFMKLERAAAKATGGTIVDLSNDICPATSCPVVIDKTIVYRDAHHLTATFARSLAPLMAEQLPDAVGVGGGLLPPRVAPRHDDAVAGTATVGGRRTRTAGTTPPHDAGPGDGRIVAGAQRRWTTRTAEGTRPGRYAGGQGSERRSARRPPARTGARSGGDLCDFGLLGGGDAASSSSARPRASAWASSDSAETSAW